MPFFIMKISAYFLDYLIFYSKNICWLFENFTMVQFSSFFLLAADGWSQKYLYMLCFQIPYYRLQYFFVSIRNSRSYIISYYTSYETLICLFNFGWFLRILYIKLVEGASDFLSFNDYENQINFIFFFITINFVASKR